MECTDMQHVVVERMVDDRVTGRLTFPGGTGNCVLIPTNPAILLYSKFELGYNECRHPVDRWSFCSNWTIDLSEPGDVRRAFRGRIGFLARCQPIMVNGRWLLPAYREKNCYGTIMASKDGRDWWRRGSIGSRIGAVNGRFGNGSMMQPTLWYDGRTLHALLRDVTPTRRAWYFTSDNHGRSWSLPLRSGLTNANNSLVALHDDSGSPFVVWNHGNDRRCLVLGRWNGAILGSSPLLRLSGRTGSYPNYCWDGDRLHIVHTSDGTIVRHLLDREALDYVESHGSVGLHVSDLPDWRSVNLVGGYVNGGWHA